MKLFISVISVIVFSSFALAEKAKAKLDIPKWPACNEVLAQAPKPFGNIELEDVSMEFAGIIRSYGEFTGKIVALIGEPALILYQKGWEFDFQGADMDKWYPSRMFGFAQARRSVKNTILETSDIYDIRLKPKYSKMWRHLLVRVSDLLHKKYRPGADSLTPEDSLAQFSMAQREGILFAYLSGGLVVSEGLRFMEIMTESQILQASGFNVGLANDIATYLFESKYDIFNALRDLPWSRIQGEELPWVSSRPGFIAPPPLPN